MSTYTLTKTGEAVTVLSTNLGWTQVQLADGSTRKVRSSWLSIDGQPTAKETRVRKPSPKAAKAKPAAKSKSKAKVAKAKVAKAKVEAYEIKGEKIVTIGETSHNITGYFVGDQRTASGRRTIDTNDAVAEKLRGMDLKSVYAEAAKHIGVTQVSLVKQYEHLNPGMQRMNLGNRIRGAISKAAAEKAEKAA